MERGGRVLAFDLDPAAAVPPDLAERVTLVRRNFAELDVVLDELGEPAIDGALFDLGVSSMQFDRPERGFSLRFDGPLDMRMSGDVGESAYDLLARLDEQELADTIFTLGEERASRRIARAIVAARGANRLPTRTLELAGLIAGVVQVRGKRERVHPATRTFQALRIVVNGEMEELDALLEVATRMVRTGGRIVMISFHSLEDRKVKESFRELARSGRGVILTKKPIVPGEREVRENPPSRSAKLRAAETAEISQQAQGRKR